MKTILKILFLFSLTCLTACHPTLSVKSEPAEAEVFIQPKGAEAKISLGKTPLSIPVEEIQGKAKINPSSGDYVELSITKKGFATERILVPPTRLGNMETIVVTKLKEGTDESLTANKLLNHLYTAQKFANQTQFERAQAELDKALELEPRFSKALSLRGSIYFIQKNYPEALNWFEKSLASDPGAEDSIKMISQIKKIQGDQKPAEGVKK